LIERAFALAGKAPQPVRRKTALYVSSLADNSAEYLSQAYGLGLDALSLRVRAVRAMLSLDARHTREMFEQIPARLPLPDVTCADAMVYDVSEFYALAGEIALKSFSAEEIAQGVRVRFLLSYVESISSLIQAVPVIKLVLAAGLRPEEMALLVPTLTKTINQLSTDDDRSFVVAVYRDGFVDAAGDLTRQLEKRKDGLARDFADACRGFIRANTTGKRCAEYMSPTFLRYLIDVVSPLFKPAFVKPEDFSPSEVGGRAVVVQSWQTPTSQSILNSYKRLRFGDDSSEERISSEGTFLPREDIGTPEWDAQLRIFLSDLEGWDGSDDESKLGFFNEQQILYMGLLELAPTGQARSEVLASWLKSLGSKRVGEPELLRYFYASELLKAIKNSPPATRDDFLTRMIYSNDAALSTFAKEARLKL
jgi:hypothetical protein